MSTRQRHSGIGSSPWACDRVRRDGGRGDNAHIESFFHSLKAEVIHGARFTTETALRRELARYVRYYNHWRLHSALGYRSPVDYESRAA